MPTRPRAALAALLAVGALAAGCGEDEPAGDAAGPTTTEATDATGTPETTGTTAAGGDDNDGDDGGSTTSVRPDTGLPPLESYTIDDITELQAVYGPPLAELDLVITRGGVVEFRGGNHLQLYAEPTTAAADNPPQVFLDRMLTSFQALLPLLFDAYPDLDSFDLCQEPVPDPTTPPTEPGYEEPVTLFLITREGYESVEDWSTATLTDLFAVAGEELDDLGYSEVAPEVASLPAFQEATAG